VLKNGTALGTLSETETSKVFNFNIGDTFSFTATPASGYKFDKFCADQACVVTTTTNPFTGPVTQATGELFTFFAASTEVGTISFASNPLGADIILDNVPQASKTPANVTNVPVGSHTYTLKLSGYDDYTGTITVQANTTATVSATLTKSGIPSWVLAGTAVVILGGTYYIVTRHPTTTKAYLGKAKRAAIATHKAVKAEAGRAKAAYRELRA
jgi:hypothetical protein